MAVSVITRRLLSTLERLHVLLAEHEPRWAESMARLNERAEEATSTHEAREVVSDVLSLYAGMGSFNDLVLQDRTGVLPEQRELSRLRALLYEEASACL